MMGAQVLARVPRNQRVNERGTPEECQDMHVLKMNVLYARVNHPGIIIPDLVFPEPRAQRLSPGLSTARDLRVCVLVCLNSPHPPSVYS